MDFVKLEFFSYYDMFRLSKNLTALKKDIYWNAYENSTYFTYFIYNNAFTMDLQYTKYALDLLISVTQLSEYVMIYYV